MTEYREIEFIPTDWVDRAARQPGLQVYSRPIRAPVDVPQRRKTDRVERLLREALYPAPFQSIDLEAEDYSIRLVNTVAQLDRALNIA